VTEAYNDSDNLKEFIGKLQDQGILKSYNEKRAVEILAYAITGKTIKELRKSIPKHISNEANKNEAMTFSNVTDLNDLLVQDQYVLNMDPLTFFQNKIWETKTRISNLNWHKAAEVAESNLKYVKTERSAYIGMKQSDKPEINKFSNKEYAEAADKIEDISDLHIFGEVQELNTQTAILRDPNANEDQKYNALRAAQDLIVNEVGEDLEDLLRNYEPTNHELMLTSKIDDDTGEITQEYKDANKKYQSKVKKFKNEYQKLLNLAAKMKRSGKIDSTTDQINKLNKINKLLVSKFADSVSGKIPSKVQDVIDQNNKLITGFQTLGRWKTFSTVSQTTGEHAYTPKSDKVTRQTTRTTTHTKGQIDSLYYENFKPPTMPKFNSNKVIERPANSGAGWHGDFDKANRYKEGKVEGFKNQFHEETKKSSYEEIYETVSKHYPFLKSEKIFDEMLKDLHTVPLDDTLITNLRGRQNTSALDNGSRFFNNIKNGDTEVLKSTVNLDGVKMKTIDGKIVTLNNVSVDLYFRKGCTNPLVVPQAFSSNQVSCTTTEKVIKNEGDTIYGGDVVETTTFYPWAMLKWALVANTVYKEIKKPDECKVTNATAEENFNINDILTNDTGQATPILD